MKRALLFQPEVETCKTFLVLTNILLIFFKRDRREIFERRQVRNVGKETDEKCLEYTGENNLNNYRREMFKKRQTRNATQLHPYLTPCPPDSPHSLAKKTSVTRVGAGPLTLLEAAARSILETEGQRALAGSDVPLELKTILRYCLPPPLLRL